MIVPRWAIYPLLFLVFGLNASSTAIAADAPATPPVPEGARVALELPQGTSYVLGDVIELAFVLSNSGRSSFAYDIGGDYRGTGFPLRYKFKVVDATGTELSAAAWQGAFQMGGGLRGPRELQAGDQHRQPLTLQNYVQVDRPGTFKVSVTHDFGWTEAPGRPRPVAEATIVVALPTAAQAEARVRAIATAAKAAAAAAAARTAPPSTAGVSAAGSFAPLLEGSLATPWNRTEYRHLNHPAFLPALEEIAAEGEIQAMEGIHRLPSVDSTRALLRLLKDKNPDVMFGAALFLSRKLPLRHTVTPHGPGVRVPGNVNTVEQSAALSKYWLPEGAEPLRAAAAALLVSKDVTRVRTGATIVEFIGTPADAPVLLEALKPLTEFQPVRAAANDNILNFPGAGDALVEALAALRERGYRAPRSGGMEVILARLLELADPAIPRTPDAERTLRSFFNSQHPVLGVASVRALPRPAGGEWAPLLDRALNSPDRGVLLEACRAAAHSANPAVIETLANIIRTETNTFILDEASTALTKLGGHLPATDAWIERLSSRELLHQAFRFLGDRLEHPKSNGSGSGSGTADRNALVAMRAKWIRFFSEPERRAQVEKGIPVPITDDQARDLFSNLHVFHVDPAPGRIGNQWPPPP